MKVKASLDASSLKPLIERKKKAIARVKEKTLKEIGKEQVELTQERIRSSKTDPMGRPWAPWSLATLRQRQREGNQSRGLLYRTGALLTSIQYSVKDNILKIFTKVPYAQHLQYGTPKMPARPFIGWGDQLNTIVKRIKDALNDK